jgi:serine/threonine protein phosphatase PrpC
MRCYAFSYLVVACDGLWDILENESVLDFVSSRMEDMKLSEIAQDLVRNRSLGPSPDQLLIFWQVDYAVEIGTMDNCTCVIVGLS